MSDHESVGRQNVPTELRADDFSSWSDVCADAFAQVPPEGRASMSGRNRGWLALRCLIKNSGMRCVLLYRVGRWARQRLPVFGVVVARICHLISRHWYGCAISYRARIGGGLILPHPQGIVIGPGVVIGRSVWVFQSVTIGGAPGRAGMPKVGSDTVILTGSVLAGPITIGNQVIIGANAVVATDVADGMIVRAPAPQISPARARKVPSDEPAA